jgi:hypothetical protein
MLIQYSTNCMSGTKDILNEQEMGASRSPGDLSAWVDAKVGELVQTEAGKAYVRSGTLLPKKLMEEIRPLGLFANRRFGSDGVMCIPNLGNANFDGQLQFSDQSKAPVYVEFTYAKDGYDERLRLDVLNREGSVNVLGRISKAGTKAARNQRVVVENEAVDHDLVVNTALALVKERLVGKSGKHYGPQYVLVVIVDDYIAFRSDADRVNLSQCAKSAIETLTMDFGAIYLLGSSGEYLERIAGEI